MTAPTRLVLATANPDKVAEIAAILHEVAGEKLQLLSRPADAPDVVEDGDTLEANARLKAVALVALTGQAAVADDTGLEVDALDGAPGVWSARFAGHGATYADNVAELLRRLDTTGAVSPTERRACFRTVALARYPDGAEHVAEGRVHGVIIGEPRGDGGFGYDPVFVPDDGDGRTFAEMSAEEKHAISHRGRAFRALAALLVTR